ncbi:MAG: glycerophosphodiester phosphodiesterase family protein [Thiohalocapsa sp.]
MSLRDTWYDVYAKALLGQSIGSALIYDLFYKLLGAALLTPIAAFVLNRLIRTSGGVSITNEAIAGFLLSAPGILFALSTVALTLASFYAEQAGLMHIASGASRGRATGWADALATAISALPRLLHLALWQAGILLLWLLPLAALGALTYLTLLGEHDINWYLANRPPRFHYALMSGAVLGVAAAGILLWYLVDWVFAIPVCLYEDERGRAALRRSHELVQGHRLWALSLLALNLTLAVAFAATVLWLTDTVVEIALGALQGIKPLIAATAVALALMLAVAALMSFLLLTVYAVIVIHLYLNVLGADGMPRQRWKRAARAARVPRLAIVGLLVALLGSAALIADNRLSDLRIGRDVDVTAHRGSSRYAPENTLAALYQAISDGADYAEIDVQESADGVVVLLHDTDLMRIAGLPTKIWDAEFAALRSVDAGSWFSPDFNGERIPTLQEALIVAGDKLRLNIELKFNGHDQRLAERAIELVREADFTERCVFTSLNQDGLVRVRELAPELRIGQIVTVAVGDVTKLDVDLLSMNQDQVTPSQVRANRRAGVATHVWTVNDQDDMSRMLDYGVDNIITDEPATLRALIDERAKLSDGELLLLSLGRQLRD